MPVTSRLRCDENSSYHAELNTMDSTSRRRLSAPRPFIALLAASLALGHAFAATPSFAQPKGAPAAPADPGKKALDLYKKGQVLHKANKFAEALPLFRESFALVPSPNSRLYIARCLAATNDPVAAYLEFEAVIADIDVRAEAKYADTRLGAVQERDEVANKIALVTVTVANAAPNTLVSLGGKDFPRESWGKAVPLAPGSVEVSVTTPPALPLTQQLDLRAGEKRPVALDAVPQKGPDTTPPPTTSSGSRGVLRPVAYLAGGIGVAGFVAFGVGGALATSTYGDLEKKCAPGAGARVCPTDSKSQIDAGKTQQLVANIGLGVGAAGLATGVLLFVLSRDSGPKKDQAPTVQPVVGPSYLGVQGTF